MARSYRKHPCFGWSCAESDKDWKVSAHRRWRRKNRQLLLQLWYQGKEVLLLRLREVSDVWKSNKDGRQWVNPKKIPEVLRK